MPPALARYLEANGHVAEHVIDLNLESAPDGLVWDAAQTRGAVILTKDGDFAALRALGEMGPPVVWIRLGNTTTPALLQAWEKAWPAVLAALTDGEDVIEVR